MSDALAIIGVGGIGSRHLQALARLPERRRILVVDPSETALCVARERWEQMEGHDGHEVLWHASVADLDEVISVSVIATPAAVRLDVLSGLLDRVAVRDVILEKVLFQREQDYAAATDALSAAGARAWVNTPRRLWSGYANARERFDGDGSVSLRVAAFGRYGLATSAIHFLDALAYVGKARDFDLSGDMLELGDRASRRPGHVEYSGVLHGYGASGGAFEFRSHGIERAPVLVDVSSDHRRLLIDETAGRAFYADEETDWKMSEQPFASALQSALTHRVVQDLEAAGRCDLPTLAASSGLHLAIHRALVAGHERLTGDRLDTLPIT